MTNRITTAPPSEKQLAEIRERAEAATPGPWHTYQNGSFSEDVLIDIAADLHDTGHGYRCRRYIGQLESGQMDNDPTHSEWNDDQDNEQSAADAEFIAHARTDIPTLLTEIDRLHAQLAELDRSVNELITERDELRDRLDGLAYAVAPIEWIGEHSSGNDPWANVIDYVTPAPVVDRLRAELAARPSRAEVLREAAAEGARWADGGIESLAVGFFGQHLRRLADAAERGEG